MAGIFIMLRPQQLELKLANQLSRSSVIAQCFVLFYF